MASRPGIVIIGGGIGGLFAANALIAQGLKVSVYEQAPALTNDRSLHFEGRAVNMMLPLRQIQVDAR